MTIAPIRLRRTSLLTAVLCFAWPVTALAKPGAVAEAPATPPTAETGGAPPAKTVRFSTKPRTAYLRGDLPENLQPELPWEGIYASGGGLTSPAWRVLVTLAGDLRAGNNPRPGSSALNVVDRKRRKLDPAVLRELVALADKAWREKRKKLGTPNADYSELLIVADGPHVYYLDGHGPIRGGAAADLVRRLQTEAAK